ncbi:MAG: hypothetical protein CMF48_04425 [Legionellales bacterium]|nr:hypothetical protein [Legionellales bacterium]|tara:strand:- start:77 stop:415 length:339 start_codon:yes stop_codon:yes gene_type:complete
MNLTKLLTAAPILIFALSGCQMNQLMHLETIEQGNIFTGDMVAQLSTGMDKEQVRAIMGDPVLRTPFHPNQWVYAYRADHRFGHVEQKHVLVQFDGDEVIDVKTEISDLFDS